jgi:molybdopterin/thiamine biosynthesis adenylyltransferase
MERYSRQILFQPIGLEGQEKINASRVVVVGAGALGTVIANHLVRSGVGYIRIIDRDLVEFSNLQRQILYTEEDAALNLPKAEAAKNRLEKINSNVTVEAVVSDLNVDNAEDLLTNFNCIVDGTDNFMTRFLINDVAVKYGVPWIHGAAVSSRGMFAAILPGKTPCYRCLFPNVPTGRGETCDTIGVISPITSIIGSFQAAEVLKILVGADTSLNLEQLDVWDQSYFQMDISGGRNPDCPACGKHQYEFLDATSIQQEIVTTLCGRETVQIYFRKKRDPDLFKLAEQLKRSGKVTVNPNLLRFSPNEELSLVMFKDGRILIHGTNDIGKAKQVYSKYIGN